MKTLFFTIGLIGLLSIFLVFTFPKSIQFESEEVMEEEFSPVELIRGIETVESVIGKIENNVLLRLNEDLKLWGGSELPAKIKLVGLKEERILQVYGSKEGVYSLFKSYPFTGFSGKLGPKLREGDRQIPEGIYRVEFLNPNSAYHLSIKINFPNRFDWQKARLDGRSEPGSDIFIHGKSVTIGCIPIGDLAIEELFYLLERALPNGVEMIISPRDFRVNPEFPEIDIVSWSSELYEKIMQNLARLPLN